MSEKTVEKTYCGIADCHGIESFTLEKDTNIDMLRIRAASNPQRAATVYKATMNPSQVKEIKKYLKEEKYIAALSCLKIMGTGHSEGLGKLEKLEVINPKYWKKIPNPRFDTYDPYYDKKTNGKS